MYEAAEHEGLDVHIWPQHSSHWEAFWGAALDTSAGSLTSPLHMLQTPISALGSELLHIPWE